MTEELPSVLNSPPPVVEAAISEFHLKLSADGRLSVVRNGAQVPKAVTVSVSGACGSGKVSGFFKRVSALGLAS
jgi:hypothetical protein